MIRHRYFIIIQLILFFLLLSCSTEKISKNQVPGKTWLQYQTPEDAGFSSEKLSRVKAFYDSLGSAALFVVYKGIVLVDWGETYRRFKCHSMRKSFLSALYGIYIDKGIIDTAKTLAELGIDDKPFPLTNTEKTARIVDLLSARSGIYLQAAYEPARNRKPPRGTYPPGTHWCYNNWDFNTLLTIFEQETGKKIFEEFNTHFAEPLQMEHFHPSHGYYHYELEKSMHPAYPFRMSARDLARFGLLFLNKGRWANKQILSKDYVRRSTSLISHDPTTGTGYGYMWWVHQTEPFKSNGMYSALGSGEHSIDVLPGADMVLIHRPNTYHWKRITYQQRRRLIQLVLESKVGKSQKNVTLNPITNPGSSFKSIQMTESEKNALTGTYLKDGNRFPFIIENIDGQLKADFGEGKVGLHKIGEDHFIIEDWNDDVYFIDNEDGKRELICIITLLMEGDYYLNRGKLDKALVYYKKAKKYYRDDPRVAICMEDVERQSNK